MTQSDLTARIDEMLKATEGHSTAPWGLDEMVMRDRTGLGICHFYFRDEDGSPVTPLFFDQDAALIASAPTLRALLVEARAQIAAQAEALAEAGKADRLIREWFAEMVGVEKAEGEYRQDQTLGEALTQAHTRKLRAEIKLATYAAPSAAARFGLTESNADTLLGAQS